ncbi:type IX secretion system protein PorD [Ekhidna sp.]
MRIFGLALLFITSLSFSQELNCRVIVNAQQVQTTERAVFAEMETEFAQFLNTTKWTNDSFEEEEVISCNLVITISEMPSIGVFRASVQVLSSRPVYGSSYESVILNFADRDWDFEYVQSQPLRFNENTFTSNITSMLAYYAYMIIGFDYDTFSELGGTPHFENAFKIVNNAQQTNYTGWQQFNSVRNRYWLVENLQNPQLEPIRKALYNYHRNALDIITDDRQKAEKTILEALSGIQRANRARPRSILTISFMDAKSGELQQLFSESNLATRRQAYNLLSNIDPSRTDEYKSLIE